MHVGRSDALELVEQLAVQLTETLAALDVVIGNNRRWRATSEEPATAVS